MAPGSHLSEVRQNMDKKRLEYYKKKLLNRRDELVKTITRTEEEGRQADDDPTVDLADKAAKALKRIRSEEYGTCANCQEEMQQKRLEAVPWAKHCITCQEKKEQGLL